MAVPQVGLDGGEVPIEHLTAEENEFMCRVEGDAPMGEFIRRFWIPVFESSELVAEGAPKQIKLLGQEYVAFRDSNGELGFIDAYCPHRGAPMVLARNELCALQCLYHGWRINRDGKIVETPSEPDRTIFDLDIHSTAYPCEEAGGMVWVYLGPADKKPALPNYEWVGLPADQRFVIWSRIECNWVQALEGIVDTSHVSMLHTNIFRPEWAEDLERQIRGEPEPEFDGVLGELTQYNSTGKFDPRVSKDTGPVIHTQETPYGFRYAAERKTPDPNLVYTRTSHMVAPLSGYFAGPPGWAHMQVFVPMDDYTTKLLWIQYRVDGQTIDETTERAAREYTGLVMGTEMDHTGRRFRNAENLWKQDREAMQRRESFTGIPGFASEDFAIQEGQGPLFDRSREHLGKSDLAVIRMRRVLIDRARNLQQGIEPQGLPGTFDLSRIRGGEGIIPVGQPWYTVDCFDLETVPT